MISLIEKSLGEILMKHDPSAPKTVITYSFFNEREINFFDVKAAVKNVVDDFLESVNADEDHEATWRGTSWWWDKRMSELETNANNSKNNYNPHFYRWWCDRYVEWAGYSLFNYLYDHGRMLFKDDGEDVSSRKKKTADQKADEYATEMKVKFYEMFA